jgi:hypothetical protein
MATFVDGPAADVYLSLRRAPKLLRVVRSSKGNWDALDQLDDTPKPSETIFVYELMNVPQIVHMKMSPRSLSGYYAINANYRLYHWQPADEEMRDTEKWRAWCADAAKKLELFSPEMEDSDVLL